MRAVHEELKASFGTAGTRRKERRIGRGADAQIDTAVPAERLRELNEQLLAVPEGFTVHPKLAKALERRRETARRRGRDRLGAGGGARVRQPPRRRERRCG